MAQNIEFFLHPPSPKITTTTFLPSVSSLLEEEDMLLLSPTSSISSSYLPPLSPNGSIFSSNNNNLEAVEPYSSTLNDNSSSPSLSPFMGSLSLVDSPMPISHHNHYSLPLLLPPPTNTRSRNRSYSNASTNSTCSSFSSILNEPISPTVEDVDSIPTPVKRKRGRPPNTTKQNQVRDNWTFVTPTVWNVHHDDEAEEAEEQVNSTIQHNNVSQWSNNSNNTNLGQNTFTNTSMDTALSMPKKKRGRKPKMQLAGNFCFVWRDLTARRDANRRKTVN